MHSSELLQKDKQHSAVSVKALFRGFRWCCCCMGEYAATPPQLRRREKEEGAALILLASCRSPSLQYALTALSLPGCLANLHNHVGKVEQGERGGWSQSYLTSSRDRLFKETDGGAYCRGLWVRYGSSTDGMSREMIGRSRCQFAKTITSFTFRASSLFQLVWLSSLKDASEWM